MSRNSRVRHCVIKCRAADAGLPEGVGSPRKKDQQHQSNVFILTWLRSGGNISQYERISVYSPKLSDRQFVL